jgi:hypothetical protein
MQKNEVATRFNTVCFMRLRLRGEKLCGTGPGIRFKYFTVQHNSIMLSLSSQRNPRCGVASFYVAPALAPDKIFDAAPSPGSTLDS